MRFSVSRPALRLVIVVAVASVIAWNGVATILAGGSQASAIRACVKSATGALRIVSATAKCKPGEKLLVWNVQASAAAGPDVYIVRSPTDKPPNFGDPNHTGPYDWTVATLEVPPGTYVAGAAAIVQLTKWPKNTATGQYVEQVELHCGFYGVSGTQARSLATESGVLEKDYWPWLSYWPFYLTYPVTVAQGETLEFRCGSTEPWARGNVFTSNTGFSAQPAGNIYQQ